MKKYKGERLQRTFNLQRASVDEKNRTVELAFSSEEPYERWFGIEILDHKPKSIRLNRLRNGGALLVNHKVDQQVGVTLSAQVGKDKKARATVKFSQSDFGNEIFMDVRDGIRQLVSVGYVVHKFEEKTENGVTTVRALDWEPYEISIVSIPADTSVGVGRSQNIGESNMFEFEDDEEQSEKEAGVKTRSDQHRSNRGDKNEKERIDCIRAMATVQNEDDLGNQAVAEGWSYERFNAAVLHKQKQSEKTRQYGSDWDENQNNIGMDNREIGNYSFTRLLAAMIEGKRQYAPMEIEASEAYERQLRKNGITREAQGLLVPPDVLQARNFFKRDLSAGTATDGAELVSTNLLAGSFIDVLRNAMVTARAGARMLPGLVGNVDVPRKTSGASATWVSAEDGDATQSDPQFDQVSMTPKDLACYTQFTRRLLLQSTPAIEGLVREDLAQAIASGIDFAALYGSGASGQPTGITNQTGINTFNFAAADPTFAEVVNMETQVDVDNALMGQTAYIMDATMKGALKTTDVGTDTGKFVWSNNKVNDHNAYSTAQVTDGDVFFGNFNDLLIGMWSGLDINVDPYTHSLKGKTRIVAFQTVDIAVRHPESFCHCNDGV